MSHTLPALELSISRQPLFLLSILQHNKKTDCLSVKKIAYSTFVNYRNVIYNHLLKSISPRIYITNIESSDLIKFMDSIASNPLRCNAYAVISSSFKTAKEFNIIAQTRHLTLFKQSVQRCDRKKERRPNAKLFHYSNYKIFY